MLIEVVRLASLLAGHGASKGTISSPQPSGARPIAEGNPKSAGGGLRQISPFQRIPTPSHFLCHHANRCKPSPTMANHAKDRNPARRTIPAKL
jgi:hypothetical protein